MNRQFNWHRGLHSEGGGNKAVKVCWTPVNIRRRLNIVHDEIKPLRKTFKQERDLIQAVLGRLLWHHTEYLTGEETGKRKATDIWWCGSA